MCEAEHLVENVMYFVEQHGWNFFKSDEVSLKDITKNKLECFAKNGNTEISFETLRWLFTLARYVEYHRVMFDELPVITQKEACELYHNRESVIIG